MKILFLLMLDLAVLAFVFSISGAYNLGVDGPIYASQISAFMQHAPVSVQTHADAERLFLPLYGILGSFIAPPVGAYSAILILNILFLIGLTFSMYYVLRRLEFTSTYAIIGTIWMVFSYPMLKYGLALGTDISGWFFLAVVVALALRAFEKNSIRWMLLASVVGFIGSLTKETGLLGLIFAGVYILFQFGNWTWQKIVKWLVALCVPFFALEGTFLYILYAIHAPTFLEWYKGNEAGYAKEYYKLHYFIGVEASTFSLLLLFATIGVVFAYISRDVFKRSWVITYAALAIATIPVLLWPQFISRVLFAQFIFVIPLALYGIMKLDEKRAGKKFLHIPLMIYESLLPLVISIGLFLLSGKGSLFEILPHLH